MGGFSLTLTVDSQWASKKALFWIVIAEIVLYVVLDAIAQILPPHYSPISQAESDLAVGKYRFIMTINFVNRGVLSIVFLLAFLRTLDLYQIKRSDFRLGSSLIAVWAIGALILAIFPTDVPPAPVSGHGAIHLVVAIIAFIGGAFGTLVISLKMASYGVLRELRRIALPIAMFWVAAWVVEFVLPIIFPHLNSKIGGLTERIFLGSVLLWLFAVSAFFVSRPRIIEDRPRVT